MNTFFQTAKKLANAKIVTFLHASSVGTYFEQGVLLRFVKGYTKSEVKRESVRRNLWLRQKYDSFIVAKIIEEHRRGVKKSTPLRPLDTDSRVLILYFDSTVNDYCLRWEKVKDISLCVDEDSRVTSGVSEKEVKEMMKIGFEALKKQRKILQLAHNRLSSQEKVNVKKHPPMITGNIKRVKARKKFPGTAPSISRHDIISCADEGDTLWLEKLLPPKKPQDPSEAEPVTQ